MVIPAWVSDNTHQTMEILSSANVCKQTNTDSKVGKRQLEKVTLTFAAVLDGNLFAVQLLREET